MLNHTAITAPQSARPTPSEPLLICLFGSFRLLWLGSPVPIRADGKGAMLLASLALRFGQVAPREFLLQRVWPNSERVLAGQSLNSLVYSLHRLLRDALHGAEPIVYSNGSYRLNVEAGIGVDVQSFDGEVGAGEQLARAGQLTDAAAAFDRAVALYQGDLCVSLDVEAIVERERLRARYLTLLAWLGDRAYAARDYGSCLANAGRLLASDPCREDAHRLAMRCYARRGERAQALRQFRLLETIMRAEFDAAPEPATIELFEQIRLNSQQI